MHERGKSDPAVVARKSANKAEQSAAEPVERRAGTKRNASQHDTHRTLSRASVPHGLERIRQTAREKKKEERFTALLHHVSTELLETAFFALKEHAAPGVDGLTWRDYEQNLEGKFPLDQQLSGLKSAKEGSRSALFPFHRRHPRLHNFFYQRCGQRLVYRELDGALGGWVVLEVVLECSDHGRTRKQTAVFRKSGVPD